MAVAATAFAGVDNDRFSLLIEKEMCERSLRNYVECAWKLVEPATFVEGWIIDALCEHLQAVTEGKIRNLIINVPPRHTKSLTTCVFWPTWQWGPRNKPASRWMFFSYSLGLSHRDALKARTLINSDWYQGRWGDRFALTPEQNSKTRYNNTHNGFRYSTSVGGQGTGEGGEYIVIDDAHNLKTIQNEAPRAAVINWWDTVMPTRLNDPKTSATVIIMQRGHHGDLIGHIKETTPEMFDWLVLPAEFDKSRRSKTSIGWTDPRTKEGELLWPARFGKPELTTLKKKLGTYAAAAQLQQNPSPAEGGIIKRAWLHHYQVLPCKMKEFDMVCQSWDMAFKGLATSSYVVGLVWAVKGANIYLLDRIREHLTFTETIKAVKAMTEKCPLATFKFVEDKANGTAIIDTLKDAIPGLIATSPGGQSKESRAHAVSPDFEAGNIHLPAPSLAPWIEDYIEQLAQFPMGSHSDDMDATSQAILEIRARAPQSVDNLPDIVSVTRTSSFIGRA